jgi:hypothetical protein
MFDVSTEAGSNAIFSISSERFNTHYQKSCYRAVDADAADGRRVHRPSLFEEKNDRYASLISRRQTSSSLTQFM